MSDPSKIKGIRKVLFAIYVINTIGNRGKDIVQRARLESRGRMRNEKGNIFLLNDIVVHDRSGVEHGLQKHDQNRFSVIETSKTHMVDALGTNIRANSDDDDRVPLICVLISKFMETVHTNQLEYQTHERERLIDVVRADRSFKHLVVEAVAVLLDPRLTPFYGGCLSPQVHQHRAHAAVETVQCHDRLLVRLHGDRAVSIL